MLSNCSLTVGLGKAMCELEIVCVFGLRHVWLVLRYTIICIVVVVPMTPKYLRNPISPLCKFLPCRYIENAQFAIKVAL